MTPGLDRTADMAIALKRQGLNAALGQISSRLGELAAGKTPAPFIPPEDSALPALARVFDLGAAELELIVLACGHELDEGLAEAIRAGSASGALDPGFAERLIGPKIWDVLCPEAPLRHWRLIETQGNGPLRRRPIRLDERILHALIGNAYLDARLSGLVHRCAPPDAVGLAEHGIARTIAHAWSGAERLPLVLLGGHDRLSKRDLAAVAVRKLGIRLFRLDAADIPADWAQRDTLRVLLDRELALSGAAILIEAEPETAGTATALADLLTGPTIVSAGEPPLGTRAPRLRLDVNPPDFTNRQNLWRRALGPRAEVLGDMLERISGQFALEQPEIVAAAALAHDPAAPPHALAPAVWQAARAQARKSIDSLAERIEARASWEDLVLPADQVETLRDLEGHMRESWRINEAWGWAAKSPRGLGAASLFAGPSGTGKTLAAEVLATSLTLDLYRIDLSQVVSKYIGETEKNLARIFTAAEEGGAILLFDEADALFGKRSEVRDSHDRYANVEISYLLQKMETYRGLAILTTNMKSALDNAFLRRLRYVVSFPFPDAAARAEIWARIFPRETPREGVDPTALSRLNVSGGSIRSIALNAAYLAAAAPEPVRMRHLRRAAQREYAKLEKTFTTAEKEAFR